MASLAVRPHVSFVTRNLVRYYYSRCFYNLNDVNFSIRNAYGSTIIQNRAYRPYMVTPKKYLKPKNRDKKDRDDVYFITDQMDPRYSVDQAIDIIKAYDLFGNEKIHLIMKMDLGQGKVKLSLFFFNS